MNGTILFRADASRLIGYGHVMRSLSLADALARRGYRPVYVCRHLPDALQARISERGFDICHLPHDSHAPEDSEYGRWLGTSEGADAEATLAIAARIAPCGVVVDHYALGQDWETRIRNGCRQMSWLLAYDDLQRVHDADLILDMTAGAVAGDYAGLIRPEAAALTGADYATLRPVFAERREQAIEARRQRLSGDAPLHLIISLGGADKDNVTGRIIEALNLLHAHPFTFDVVVGAGYEHVDALNARLHPFGDRCRLHVNTRIMVDLMARADLAIGAAGSTSWERCTLGLPAIHAVIADNQQRIARQLERLGASITLADPFTTSAEVVSETLIAPLLEDRLKLARMSRAAAGICDGRGAERVADVLDARRQAVA